MKKREIDADKELVTVMMPVFNGEKFIAQALDSLLSQDYKNFELIILDNRSSDNTREICYKYSQNNPKIKYICDSTEISSAEVGNRLAKYINGYYCMFACDDDLWDSNYISSLVRVLKENSHIGVTYSMMQSVNENGITRPNKFNKSLQLYGDSKVKNIKRYLFKRSVVPMIFGVFKTQLFKDALPFKPFDKTLYDVDNLFMLRVLSLTPVRCVKDTNFYYREKDRTVSKEGSTDSKIRGVFPKNRVLLVAFEIKHQFLFLIEFIKDNSKSYLSRAERINVLIYGIISFIFYSILRVPLFTSMLKAIRKRG